MQFIDTAVPYIAMLCWIIDIDINMFCEGWDEI